MYVVYALLVVLLHLGVWLWRLNRSLSTTPDKLKSFVSKRWSREDILKAYDSARTAEEVSRPKLRAKKNRRYIVVGGSGTAGSWIVQHLLWRGEDPQAIRILDLNAPTRPEATSLTFLKTDVTEPSSLAAAYEAPWPEKVRSLPLTVFHCAAYISVAERSDRFLARFMKVNVEGVRSSMEMAKKVGADCFIATSSSSVAVKDVNYWHLTGPTDFIQVLPNAQPLSMDSEDFSNCYQYSKVAMEELVLKANEAGFRTGCIRPGHPIYGHGTENNNSVSWRNLTNGGGPTWLKPYVINFVHALNVSLGHLAFEDRLLVDPSVGGKGYCVTERPILYAEYYRVFEVLADAKFPEISPLLMLIMCHGIELWEGLRRFIPQLPGAKGDLHIMQPAMLKMSMAHFLFDNKLATKDLGYEPAFETLEGLCITVRDWKEKGAKRVQKGTTVAVPA